MDPNATLRAIAGNNTAPESSELCEALWEWRQKGGYAPEWYMCSEGARIYRVWLNNSKLSTDS